MHAFGAILYEMRVKQYAKNAFALEAPMFSGRLFEGDVLLRIVLAFAAFSLVASAVYIGNDIVDREKDR